MSKTVRTKFNVSELTKYGNGAGGKVVLNAVVSNSEENKTFWDLTPSGNITMSVDNPEAFKQFEEMGEFYVDFTKA